MLVLIVTPVVGILMLVAFRLATGQIRMVGLLSDHNDKPSPERLQMLLATVAVLVMYGSSMLATRHTGRPQFLDVPDNLLPLLGGSHGIYLVRKWFTKTLK